MSSIPQLLRHSSLLLPLPRFYSSACLFILPSSHHHLLFSLVPPSLAFLHLLPLPLSQKRSVPPVPSWLQPTVLMRPRVPSRLLPCRRRKKCESILEPNLILNNAHGDPLIPPSLPSPPLRGYFLDGKFFIAAALGSTLTKLAIRYLHQVAEPQSKNVRINTVASFPGLPTVQFVITYSMLKWSEEAARRFYHMN